ncbi:MAG TPA: helix-turn-helix domain-containing GNAT family N-acetyltransferase [Edaphobacter sp.]|uniref:bifunctional helix-turn-helix transcriptional regulator/GNAT family N-acetyltransferase n=1 Tax=Edaphobacter sp. TaxID=1934404 RepID=UPI002BABCB49|nr:helix-turn-helix domain-containing GNAT family N-acetyltransferase [Edaphobacter sp.]HUZ97592.1 helix-turn-helix domain-containing GNAT family N-acetyltransferase [Edaphobacter sp.]
MVTVASSPSLTSHVAAFRRFNRVYTRFIGALDEELLNSGYSLAEARVLYELATRHTPTAKEIALALGVDPAYLSRILARFEKSSLLKRTASKKDARSAYLALTRKGKSRFEKLNALSEEQARSILKALPPTGETNLIHSMSDLEQLLAPSTQQEANYVLRPHRPGDMGWVVHREAALYAQEYGFDETFEALVARIVADFLTEFDPKRERCWIAEVNGQNVGHIFLVKHPTEPSIAKLRLLLVEPSARGLRLGSVLVDECVNFARAVGYKKITLWTQSILIAAHRIYEKAGFRLVEEQANCKFSKDLVSQTWELDLTESGFGRAASQGGRTGPTPTDV